MSWIDYDNFILDYVHWNYTNKHIQTVMASISVILSERCHPPKY